MQLSEKIKYLRKRENYSQNDLAKELLIERQTISRWENNVTRPEAYNLELLSELFGVSFDWLLKEEYDTENFPDHRTRDSLSFATESETDEGATQELLRQTPVGSVSALCRQLSIKAAEQKRLAFILLLMTSLSGLIQLSSLLFSVPFSIIALYARPHTVYKKVSFFILWLWISYSVILFLLLAVGIGMWYS